LLMTAHPPNKKVAGRILRAGFATKRPKVARWGK
jgi:hypothetical protein